MNVLITAAGRRTSLVNAFAAAVHQRGGIVLAGDTDSLAPALYVADDRIRLRPVGDPSYITDLTAHVVRHGIRLLVPTIDPDLPVLAAARESLAAVGCRVVVSSEDFVRVTLDKWTTTSVLGEANVSVPRSWLPPVDVDALPPRVFVKPRRGSASRDTFESDAKGLSAVLERVSNPIVQELLQGPEITIDALLDFDGRPIHYVPRRRISTLAGESIQGVTLHRDRDLEQWIEHVLDVSSSMGAIGPLTIQAFLTPSGPILSEINPRFGGGYPLALAAGGDYPRWILDMAAGIPVPARLGQYEEGLYMTRYHVERFTRERWW